MARPSLDTWQLISRLLDDVLDLPVEARADWLETLRRREPAAAVAVAAWLDEYALVEASAFLLDGARTTPGGASLVGSEVGSYRLLEPIGQGGMGTVWLAERRDGQFDHRVAIKLLDAALVAGNAAERFSREAGILARLTHPHISRLYDAGVSPFGSPYLVLEHVRGEHIDCYCDAARLPVADRLRLFLDVLAAVAHAHANLVVHRDLKPANVLVTAEGHVTLLDFGIAKLVDGPAEAPGGAESTALTPAYAAPEQLTGGMTTTATDVHALGVLLYQLLTGHHPWTSPEMSAAALVAAIMERQPMPPSEAVVATGPGRSIAVEIADARATSPARLHQSLRGDLDTIVLTALRKDPGSRYPTVSALADDVRRTLRHEPIMVRREVVSYRVGKFIRRHRAPVALAAAAVLALVAGLVGTISQAQRADQQALEAGAQRDAARRQLSRAEAINDLNAFLIADAAPVGTTFTARDLLVRAERIVTRQQDDTDGTRIDSLLSIGRLYSTLGDTPRATAVLLQGLELARGQSDLGLTARASCELGRALVKTGDVVQSREFVAAGLSLADGPQHGMARVLCRLCGANVETWAGDGEAAITHVVAARDAGEQEALLSPLLSLQVTMQLAEAYRIAGRYADAHVAFADAEGRLVALGREETERAGTLFNNWGLVLSSLGRPRDSERLLRRSVAISSASGSDALVEPVLWGNLSIVALDLGRHDEAIVLADRSYQEALARNEQVVATQSLLGRVRARIAKGVLDESAALLDEAEARYTSTFPPDHPGFLALALDRIRLAKSRGDFVAALDLADRTLASADGTTRRRSYRSAVLRQRAAIHLGLRRFADARTDAEQAITAIRERIGPSALAYPVGESYLTIGEAYAGELRAGDARVALLEALRHLEDAAGADHPLARRARDLLARQ